MDTMFIVIKARSIHDNGNGTFAVELPCKPMTPEDQAALDRLLPDLQDPFHRLLCQQALIDAVALQSDIMAPQDRNRKKDNVKKGKSTFNERPKQSGSQDEEQRRADAAAHRESLEASYHIGDDDEVP